ncbi:PRC-barrel domain-containing protein [Collimonas sp.]|jgi:hypothetical protein|uniref:PRC-barrel domain-containing protein n=1 Tax=Collimonas sp. TaxID=1963772 RepID=UPI002CED86D3|nr:PRC-barrel domain-containing protein [Collimonas sp.]HWW06964.1 PRC-barrel domain-containing protein [Collimonas sp.]
MRNTVSKFAICAGVLMAVLAPVHAQVAGSAVLGVSVSEMDVVIKGWSAKKQLIGQTVYNAKKEKIGKIDDLIVSPEKAVSFVIIGAGGFVGIDRHDVAIPVNQIKEDAGKITLPDATKDTIKALPAFTYPAKRG